MKIEQCQSGHFFDREKYGRCPFCFPEEKSKNRTARNYTEQESEEEAVQSRTRQPRPRKDSFTDWREAALASDENRTVSEAPELMTHCYTTGWLVCVEGAEKGRDYRLRYGFNQIGRSHKMDVCIFEDDAISRSAHCSVVYEERKNQFLLVPGQGTLTMKDGRLLEAPVILEMGDRFQIGDTVLEFIPFCRGDIRWSN